MIETKEKDLAAECQNDCVSTFASVIMSLFVSVTNRVYSSMTDFTHTIGFLLSGDGFVYDGYDGLIDEAQGCQIISRF